MESTKRKTDELPLSRKITKALLIFILISLLIIFLLVLFGPMIDGFLTPILYPNAILG
jgi:hypothetical protein